MDQWQAFAVTLACEIPVMLILARRCRVSRVLFASLSANLVSHPLAWRAAMALPPDAYREGIWLIEVAVVAFEAGWYRLWLRVALTRTFLWSLLANAASLGVGWWLWSA